MKRFFLAAVVGLLASAGSSTFAIEPRPNVIVIVTDDQGFSDVGFQGCREIPTPHIDALANSGVIFDAGYVTHPYCSPSRAGLLSGRYQQRFGHECNPNGKEIDGLPTTETLLPQFFQSAGYRTAAIGKWHLGDAEKFWPTERGFDHWFGFSGGGMNYWGTPRVNKPLSGVLRNGEPVDPAKLRYLTDDFTDETVQFIREQKENPFFIYLAYNAPHSPNHATEQYLQQMAHIEYGDRAVYGAMIAAVDAGIGQIVATLEKQNLRDNTLIFFLSDNGGRRDVARNFPYRGHKGMLFEGGIRVPFFVSWPAAIPGGRRDDRPISALDIFPTCLAAAHIIPPKKLPLDGVSLLPYLDGVSTDLPHETLYWRYATGDNEYGYAVRHGDWKLVESRYKNRALLFDLASDPYEIHDLASTQPEKAKQLSDMIKKWDAKNIAPIWLDPHGANVRKEEEARTQAVEAAGQGEKK